MDRKNCEENIIITVKLKVKPAHYVIIKQEKITHEKDELIVGIYQFILLKEETYIICCNRKDKTLDYTKYAANQETALFLYKEMIKEIEKDLSYGN